MTLFLFSLTAVKSSLRTSAFKNATNKFTIHSGIQPTWCYEYGEYSNETLILIDSTALEQHALQLVSQGFHVVVLPQATKENLRTLKHRISLDQDPRVVTEADLMKESVLVMG